MSSVKATISTKIQLNIVKRTKSWNRFIRIIENYTQRNQNMAFMVIKYINRVAEGSMNKSDKYRTMGRTS
jgi:hypothetical protein